MRVPTCRVVLLVFVALTAASGDSRSQFAGGWHTKISSATGKHSITVNIVVNENTFSGSVVLVNPDGSEIESEIFNAKLSGQILEFETKIRNDVFDWRLTLQKNNKKALLHGSIGEMVIDEQVVKQR
jgi:hypothetical protein